MFILILETLVSCGPKQTQTQTTETKTEGEKPAPTGESAGEIKAEVVIGLAGDTLSMDPYVYNETISNAVLHHMYEPLILTGRDMDLLPGLAESWELSDDLMTWTFKLREGVKFHDGSDFTAEDVIFSFDRAKEPFSKFNNIFATVASYEMIDDYTVIIHSSTPDVIFLTKIKDLVIMDKETFAAKAKIMLR
ncbi:MAG: ABC transporter substrate-binding protein [Neofamilia sp.]